MIELIQKFEGKHAFLSNFSPHGFVLETISFPTNEHFFQAMKTVKGNTKDFLEIANASTPGKAKRMGRKVKMRPDWDEVKINIMKKGLEEKFRQNPDIQKLLLETGEAILVEGNHWHDNFWGDCKCENCRLKTGKNMLGILLMFVRGKISQEK